MQLCVSSAVTWFHILLIFATITHAYFWLPSMQATHSQQTRQITHYITFCGFSYPWSTTVWKSKMGNPKHKFYTIYCIEEHDDMTHYPTMSYLARESWLCSGWTHYVWLAFMKSLWLALTGWQCLNQATVQKQCQCHALTFIIQPRMNPICLCIASVNRWDWTCSWWYVHRGPSSHLPGILLPITGIKWMAKIK